MERGVTVPSSRVSFMVPLRYTTTLYHFGKDTKSGTPVPNVSSKVTYEDSQDSLPVNMVEGKMSPSGFQCVDHSLPRRSPVGKFVRESTKIRGLCLYTDPGLRRRIIGHTGSCSL